MTKEDKCNSCEDCVCESTEDNLVDVKPTKIYESITKERTIPNKILEKIFGK